MHDTISHFALDPAHLDLLRLRIEADIAEERYDGARILAAIGGKVVADITSGHASRADARPLAADSVFSVMSLTKIMVTIMLMRLVERGRLQLTTPAAAIIPEFGQHGKSQITIAQLLTHTAGLGNVPFPISIERAGILEEAAAAVCTIVPETVPGEHVSYSGQSAFTILGAIIARLDPKGRSLRQAMQEDLFAPLGMHDTAFGLPDRLRSRYVPLAVRSKHAPELNPASLAAREKATGEATELPSGGAHSTAADMMRFALMLRGGGTLDGVTVLSPASLTLMRTNHTGTKPNSLMTAARVTRGFDSYPAYLGLGLFLRGEGIFPTLFGSLSSPSTFGGFGLGSTTLWVDPVHDVTFVGLTSGLMERIESILRFQALSDMVLGALRRA